MNLLQEVILSLNKEESRFFKLYAGRTNIKMKEKIFNFSISLKNLTQLMKIK